MTKILLNTDGGSRGNPGPAAYGFVISDVTDLGNSESFTEGAGIILEKCGNYLGIETNNIAEYRGLIDGIKWVKANYPDAELIIKMDSLLIVNQVKGLYKVKSPGLYPKWVEVRQLLSSFKSWSISHTYREGNSLADSLVNAALDAHQAH